MKKFLAMLTVVAIFGCTVVGCTDADKDKKAAPAKDKDAKPAPVKDKEKDKA